MNVIQFFIRVSKNKTSDDIINLIYAAFRDSSSDSKNYHNDMLTVWDEQNSNLYSLYHSKDIVAYQEVSKIKYFIFDTSQTGSHNKNDITLDLLILSSVDSINFSVNTVIDNIKQTLGIYQNFKGLIVKIYKLFHDVVTFFNKNPTKLFLKLKVSKEANAFLFSYNTSQADIYDATHKIKVVFKNKSLNIWEILRDCIFLIIALISVALYVYGESYNISDDSGLFIGFFVSSLAFLISEIPKIFSSLNIPLTNKKLSISLENLSDSIQHHNEPCSPYTEDDELCLITSPPEEDLQ